MNYKYIYSYKPVHKIYTIRKRSLSTGEKIFLHALITLGVIVLVEQLMKGVL